MRKLVVAALSTGLALAAAAVIYAIATGRDFSVAVEDLGKKIKVTVTGPPQPGPTPSCPYPPEGRHVVQMPGCACGTSEVALLHNVISGRAGDPVQLVYEANPICRGQGLGARKITVNWGDGEQDSGPISGCVSHVYSKAGDYTVIVEVHVTCIDRGAANCETNCDAGGAATAKITKRWGFL
jgi:hypothetical protein